MEPAGQRSTPFSPPIPFNRSIVNVCHHVRIALPAVLLVGGLALVLMAQNTGVSEKLRVPFEGFFKRDSGGGWGGGGGGGGGDPNP